MAALAVQPDSPTRRARRSVILVIGACMVLAAMFSAARGDVLSGTKVKVPPKVPLKVHAFPLDDLYSYWWHSWVLTTMGKNWGRLAGGQPGADQMLHNFRVTAGLPSPAGPLCGWESPRSELRGHFVGHYLSASGLMHAASSGGRDMRVRDAATKVLKGLIECQAKHGNGYLGAFPEEFFDRLEAGKPVWAPYCTLHKLLTGLLDMYLYCDDPQALEACKKLGDWVIARNTKLSDPQMQRLLEVEHGGMAEVLANLYGVTGEEKYLKMAQRFNHWAVLEPASRREDRLNGLHANSQIAKFIGAARQYELTGDERLKRAATFFWETVVNERSYVIGGNSDGEIFTPKEKLSQALSPATCEGCATYNMLKLTRHLFCWEPKVAYMDYYERAFFNHILASFEPKDEMLCYYLPLAPGVQRTYATPTNSFWCCMGSGMESFSKHCENVYFHDGGKGFYVTLFVRSQFHWKARGIKGWQDTGFPDGEGTVLRLAECASPVELTVHVRHPGWATAGITVKVNGQPQGVASAPGSFAAITRTWKANDRLEVSTPFVLRTEAFRDNPRRLAILHGPLVLAADADPAKPFPAVVCEPGKLLAALKPVPGRPSTFIAPGEVFRVPGEKAGADVTLEPLCKLRGNRPCTVYWDWYTPSEWSAKEALPRRER